MPSRRRERGEPGAVTDVRARASRRPQRPTPSGPEGADAVEIALRGIDWTAARHAYGSAADVPHQIRALLAGDDAARVTACSELNGSIWHQNTVYDATVEAVPAIVAIARSSKAGRFYALALLIVCAEAADTRSPFRDATREAISRSLPALIDDVLAADDRDDQHGWALIAGVAAMLPESPVPEEKLEAFFELSWGSDAAALLATRRLVAPSAYAEDFPTTPFVDLAFNAAWRLAGKPPLEP